MSDSKSSKKRSIVNAPVTIAIITTVAALIAAIISGIFFISSSPPVPNHNPCLTTKPPPPLPSEEPHEILKGKSYCTPSNEWTIVIGDVTYVDPKSGSPIFVKTANGARADDPKVGSLLAVKGSVEIIGTNTASYVLFPGTTTVEQIKADLIPYEQELYSRGCQENKGCVSISVVIIQDGLRIN